MKRKKSTKRSREKQIEQLAQLITGQQSLGLTEELAGEQAKTLLTVLANAKGAASFKHSFRHFASYPEATVERLQDELRAVWNPKHKPDPIKSLASKGISVDEVLINTWLRQESGNFLVTRHPQSERLELYPRQQSLPNRLAFAVLMFQDWLKVCGNPDCIRPYFIGERVDQRYCSPECADYGRKGAKRKWWNRNRSVSARQKI